MKLASKYFSAKHKYRAVQLSLVMWLCIPAAQSADQLGVNPPINLLSGSHLTQTLLAMIAVIALIIALAWFARRFLHASGGKHGNFNVIGALSLGPRERIVLVQVGDQQVLLGVTPGHIRNISTLATPIDLSAQTSTALPANTTPVQRFGVVLQQALGRRNG